MKHWKIEVTDRAREQLIAIKDSRISQSISDRIDKLQTEPEKQGKLLKDDLVGYRSVRAVGQRYRIIYKIQEELILVLVVLVGIRKEGDKKDAYAQARRLADLGLLDNIE